jgi:hypothetical protein
MNFLALHRFEMLLSKFDQFTYGFRQHLMLCFKIGWSSTQIVIRGSLPEKSDQQICNVSE